MAGHRRRYGWNYDLHNLSAFYSASVAYATDIIAVSNERLHQGESSRPSRRTWAEYQRELHVVNQEQNYHLTLSLTPCSTPELREKLYLKRHVNLCAVLGHLYVEGLPRHISWLGMAYDQKVLGLQYILGLDWQFAPDGLWHIKNPPTNSRLFRQPITISAEAVLPKPEGPSLPLAELTMHLMRGYCRPAPLAAELYLDGTQVPLIPAKKENS